MFLASFIFPFLHYNYLRLQVLDGLLQQTQIRDVQVHVDHRIIEKNFANWNVKEVGK